MAPSVRSTNHVDDILKDDETGRDERFVDDLLAKEMLKLSVKDRNDIQEEIHGVKCLAVEENEELVQKSLKDLEKEIQNIPDSQKRAYLKSLENEHPPLQPDSKEDTTTPVAENNKNNNNNNSKTSRRRSRSYIHGDDFRLRFLRCDLFDVPKAAKRLVTYLDLLVELFGEYALKRPICLSDFSKEELRHLRKGMIQPLPYRDRSGRRIVIAFPEEDVSQIPPFVKAKIAMYQLWAMGDHDIVTQQMGIIVLCWFDASFATLSSSWKIKYKFYTLNCDRITAIHCCSPDTPHYRFRRSIMVMRVGVENRSKLIFHLGEAMEIHYKLQGYGIPFEHVPISWTGKVKVQYLKQWMRVRQAIEQKCAHDKLLQQQQEEEQRKRSSSEATSGYESNNSVTSNSTTASNSHGKNNNIIECPQLHDVVFRQGTSGTSHPGNVTFRSLIESIVLAEHCKQYEREQAQLVQQRKPRSKSSNNKQAKAKRPKQLASEIYDERQRTCSTGRFLTWNNEKGWWNTITDKEQICMKIEYMVREFQKVAQKRGILKPKKQNGSSKKHGSNFVHLQSETSMFRAQDGNPLFAANKRQRLNAIPNDDDSGNKSNMECFGVQFASCFT